MADIRLTRRAVTAGLTASLAASRASAQAFPTRPVRIIVPFAPGGGIDQVCRPLAQRLSVILGQSVVVENRAGAAGNIAMDYVAVQPADGYTLLHANSGMLTTNPTLYAEMKTKPERDLTPIARVTTDYLMIIVPSSLPARTLPEFIALVKQRPGEYYYASGGAGGVTHLGLELFCREAGLRMDHVPYRGAGPALTDLIAGRVHMQLDQVGLVKAHLDAGTVRILATVAPQRTELMPEIPTLGEFGLRSAESVSWQAIMAPAGINPAVQARLTQAIGQALALEELRGFYRGAGYVPTFAPPEEVAGRIATETPHWARLIKAADIRID